jgi:Arm domain-containing DNA-binding protein
MSLGRFGFTMIAPNSAKLAQIATKGSKSVAKFNFTKKAIDLLVSGEKRSYFYDTQVRGLALAVDPTGRKTFILYKKVHGRPERVKIGVYPDMSIDAARTQAQGMNVVIAQGGNPAEERRAVRAEMTLQELFDTWLLLYAKERKRTWKDDEWTFKHYLHGWTLKKLSSIRRQDVIDLHAQVGRKHGKYSANRVVELLSSMFNRARNDWGYEGTNPAEKIRPFKERKRSRFIDGAELPAFFKSLAQATTAAVRTTVMGSSAFAFSAEMFHWLRVQSISGHSSIQATQIYARLNLDPVCESVMRAQDAMLLAGGATALLGDGK